jgi:chaperone required for assembly of F1-ATPase
MSSPDAISPANPMHKARELARPTLPKRFYRGVEMLGEPDGFALRLDGKPALTPGRQPIVVRPQPLAAEIAAEWDAQRDVIDPATMPATRLANTAIDGVASRSAEVRESIIGYLGGDLVYYRAGEPAGLVARERDAWDPILAAAEQRHGVRFVLSEGIAHVAQPERTLAKLSGEIEAFSDPFALAGLHLATTLTGSALIALGLAAGEISVDDAWAAAHVEEDWNAAQWGIDAEAAERRARRLADFRAAALALSA